MFSFVQRLLPLACLALYAAQPSVQAAGQPDEPMRLRVEPAPALSANASIASQYVSRGFRQTWGRPAAQAGIDYVHPSGWSVGT